MNDGQVDAELAFIYLTSYRRDIEARTVTQKLDKFLHHLFMSQRRFIRSGFLFLLHEVQRGKDVAASLGFEPSFYDSRPGDRLTPQCIAQRARVGFDLKDDKATFQSDVLK